jgi:hypothetical protein
MEHRKARALDKATESSMTNNDLNDCSTKILSPQSAFDTLPQPPTSFLGEVCAMLFTIDNSAKSDSSTDHDLRFMDVQTSSRKPSLDISDKSSDGLPIFRQSPEVVDIGVVEANLWRRRGHKGPTGLLKVEDSGPRPIGDKSASAKDIHLAKPSLRLPLTKEQAPAEAHRKASSARVD